MVMKESATIAEIICPNFWIWDWYIPTN